MDDEWPSDPTFDWPSKVAPRDTIRLATGEVGAIDMVLNYSPDETPRWELIVTVLTHEGFVDTRISPPWLCRPVTDEASVQRIRAAGIE